MSGGLAAIRFCRGVVPVDADGRIVAWCRGLQRWLPVLWGPGVVFKWLVAMVLCLFRVPVAWCSGVVASRLRGHRLMHGPWPISLPRSAVSAFFGEPGQRFPRNRGIRFAAMMRNARNSNVSCGGGYARGRASVSENVPVPHKGSKITDRDSEICHGPRINRLPELPGQQETIRPWCGRPFRPTPSSAITRLETVSLLLPQQSTSQKQTHNLTYNLTLGHDEIHNLGPILFLTVR